jgi:hypothetical protein
MHKISFTIVRKNKYKNAPWYIRRRETGEKPIDINLETTDRKVAETELMRVKLAAFRRWVVHDPANYTGMGYYIVLGII